jgi:hypothetical protein
MTQSLIPARTKKAAVWLLMAFVGVAAIANVPWALTRMRWRGDVVKVPAKVLENPTSRRYWPSSTPHVAAWPAPRYWMESQLFGWRYFNVNTRGSARDDGFTMQLQRLGWPWPVIEVKQMWWDFNDPTLAGPQSDPPPSLMIAGLLFNPIALGVATWSVLVLPWLMLVSTRRALRHRKARCLDCAYPIGTSSICTECGAAVRALRQ